MFYLNVQLISPQVAKKLGCHYQGLDSEPFLEIQMCGFTYLLTLAS